MRKLLLAQLLLFSSFVMAHDLGNGLNVSDSQLHELRQRLPKTQQDKVFYHWTKLDTALRWALQGHLDRGEVNFYNRYTGSNQVYGAGIYMAESRNSSTQFGNASVVFEMARGTLLYDTSVVQSVLGSRLNNKQITELGKLLPFVRHVTSDWYLTHHPETLSKIEFGSVHGARSQWNSFRLKEIVTELKKHNGPHGPAQHLESLINLSYYMDGISFFRALKVNPRNPWSEFEPRNFEQYRRARQHYQSQTDGGAGVGIATSDRFGSGSLSVEQWIEKQMNEVIPEMYERVSGQRNGYRYYFRDEGVRAGGNQDGRTFQVSEEALEVLKKNPYLEVEYKPHPSGKGYLVSYHYPDAFHYKGLQGKISDSLFRELERTSESELWQNRGKRQRLNRRIMEELMRDLFRRHHRNNVSFKSGSVQFLVDFISIHPFADFNGRTSRLYYDVAHMEAKKPMPYSFLGDLDLLTPVEEYKEVLEKGAKAHKELVIAMLEEMMKAKAERRNPRYKNLPELEKLWTALEPVGGGKVDNIGNREMELIRRRRFAELFERLFPRDDIKTGGSCRTVFF